MFGRPNGRTSPDVVGVDEGVGRGFETLPTIEGLLARPAILALAIRDLFDLLVVLVGGADPMSDPGNTRGPSLRATVTILAPPDC